MTRIVAVLAALLLLAAYKSGGSSPPPPPSVLPAAYWYSLDAVQWTFQHSQGMPSSPAAHPDGGWSFEFPIGPDARGAASVHYLVTRSPGRPTGSRLVVDFEVIESGAPVYQGPLGDPNNTCGPPAHFDLYIQRRGGDLTARYPFHRWFFRAANLPSKGTISAPLDGAGWGAVFGQRGEQFPSEFAAALSDLAVIGLTFGWGCFAGHGVNIQAGTGTSTFRLLGLRTE
jgi:hypothetical protein